MKIFIYQKKSSENFIPHQMELGDNLEKFSTKMSLKSPVNHKFLEVGATWRESRRASSGIKTFQRGQMRHFGGTINFVFLDRIF